MDVSDLGADDEIEDFDRFLTDDQRCTLSTVYESLPIMLQWELETIIEQLCTKLDKKEQALDSITDDITSLVVTSKELFNKWDTLRYTY